MKVFVSRDKGNYNNLVYIWDRKPENQGTEEEIEWGSGEGYSLQSIPVSEFKKEFGWTPKKGSCTEVDMSLFRTNNSPVVDIKIIPSKVDSKFLVR